MIIGLVTLIAMYKFSMKLVPGAYSKELPLTAESQFHADLNVFDVRGHDPGSVKQPNLGSAAHLQNQNRRLNVRKFSVKPHPNFCSLTL